MRNFLGGLCLDFGRRIGSAGSRHPRKRLQASLCLGFGRRMGSLEEGSGQSKLIGGLGFWHGGGLGGSCQVKVVGLDLPFFR